MMAKDPGPETVNQLIKAKEKYEICTDNFIDYAISMGWGSGQESHFYSQLSGMIYTITIRGSETDPEVVVSSKGVRKAPKTTESEAEMPPPESPVIPS